MLDRRMLLRGLAAAALSGAAVVAAQDKKEPDKKEPEKRGGTVTGVVTAKGDNWIEVKADGEEKARRYTPNWVGGAPAQGGGFDKNTLKDIAGLTVKSRIRLEWTFEERPRIKKIEVIKKADDKKD